MNRDLGTRAEIEQTLDTGLDNVFSEEPAEAAARLAQDAAPTAYTEWGGGASNDEDYNLEAFVAAEVKGCVVTVTCTCPAFTLTLDTTALS